MSIYFKYIRKDIAMKCLEEEYMRYNQKRRILLTAYAAAVSSVLMTGFTSMAAEVRTDTSKANIEIQSFGWNLSGNTGGICGEVFGDTKETVEEAHEAYLVKMEEERKAAEEAKRLAEEQAAAQAAAEAKAAADTELLAALIFCEAGNQPYEGQVAVGAVVMNRVRSGSYPNSISEVIYQSGQFTPAMTGWLDSVLSSGGYTDSARQVAQDALAGSNPVGDCLYFSTGGYGMQIGDHYFH